MPLILCIETSTTACSVALCDEQGIVASREENNGYTHAENLHVFIEEVIQKSGRAKKDIAAIAVGKGPGSYTGLRIGVSAAKGLSYALGIPLLSVNSLYTMAAAVKEQVKDEDCILCPMLDARRMEIYTATYSSSDLSELSPTQALIVTDESVQQFKTGKTGVFFGDGMPKCKTLLEKLPQVHFVENIFPSALHMREAVLQAFADKRFEDVAYFEPFYLKEFFTTAKIN
jgi:tRNA threonylcarbamoyladenosine biosynthesis protein TsaB